MLESSELITNADGSIYHLGLLPEDVSDTIITVGDPERVEKVSRYFDRVELKKQKREFVTHTGYLRGKRLTVISSGIGPDNIDIVINELHALANFDLRRRQKHDTHHPLQILRMGTSGSFHPEIDVDVFLSSAYGIGLDNLLHYYRKQKDVPDLANTIQPILDRDGIPILPYAYSAQPFLSLPPDFVEGITLTAPGFYGPQHRTLGLEHLWSDQSWEELSAMEYDQIPFANLEMETAAIFGLCGELGHACMSFSAILANRPKGTFSKDPGSTVNQMIRTILDYLA